MVRFDGDTPDDIKLWHTYLYWARNCARAGLPLDPVAQPAIVDNPANRVDASLSDALQAIVFSAFALEYRLKRALQSMGVPCKSNEKLQTLLGSFWKRLSTVDRLDGKGKCAPPIAWNGCKRKLDSLVTLRNDIAHANYGNTLAYFTDKLDPPAVAREHYHAVVNALMLINIGTGYETSPAALVEEYFRPLQVKTERKEDTS
jgi:hypothetical protein